MTTLTEVGIVFSAFLAFLGLGIYIGLHWRD